MTIAAIVPLNMIASHIWFQKSFEWHFYIAAALILISLVCVNYLRVLDLLKEDTEGNEEKEGKEENTEALVEKAVPISTSINQ